ncbi:hypothetical protein, partial [Vibrio sp. 10N.222.55.C7]|uniref:hypothetical protein n=1 Tax=Vibrio sp. 10N.222.55.C7 TaxID=3229650 RepID=UPI003550B48D
NLGNNAILSYEPSDTLNFHITSSIATLRAAIMQQSKLTHSLHVDITKTLEVTNRLGRIHYCLVSLPT